MCRESEILLILPQKETNMQMCSLVILTSNSTPLILPEVQLHPPVFLCFVLVSPGPASCFTECPSMLTFLCSFHGCCQGLSWDEGTVCFDHGKDSSISRFLCNFHLVPKLSLWSTQVSALNKSRGLDGN